jgi:hypothetical protein
MADIKELTPEEDIRYRQFYCGICRQMSLRHGSLARLGLSFDLAFLGLLLHSLYEPEEMTGKKACGMHPIKPRPWVDSEYIAYCADMNVALAYYKALDDQQDKEGKKSLIRLFGKNMEEISKRYPRQCKAMAEKLEKIRLMEQENCQNPDLPAGAFGQLLEEVFVYKEDLWEQDLRQMANCLGRFIYLADGAVDYAHDKKKGSYNPFLAMGMDPDWEKWTEFLVLEMAGCTDAYERLPLVEEKEILDNILYSGIWHSYRRMQRENGKENQDGGSLSDPGR